MLTALLHSGVGDVAAVVTRYYGGTKLGTGGLARAYGGCVAQALETLPRVDKITWAPCRLTVTYADVRAVQDLVAAHGGRVLAEEYAADVTYALELPASALDAFAGDVVDATRGAALVDRDA
jgi:putative IMPACT (imprinted ancient) family translation regulator